MSSTESMVGSTAATALAKQFEKWNRIAFNNAPIDRHKVRAGADQMYRLVGLKPPENFLWVESPAIGSMAAALLSKASPNLFEPVVRNFKETFSLNLWRMIEVRASRSWWKTIEAQMSRSVDSAYGGTADGIRRAISSSVQVGWQVPDQVGFQGTRAPVQTVQDLVRWLEQSLPAPVIEAMYKSYEGWNANFRSTAAAQMWRCANGNLDIDLPFFDFCRSAGFNLPEIDGILMIAESCGFWWPLQDVFIATARPRILSADAQGRLHAVHGPAVEYPDTWSIYSWQGLVSPKRFIQFTSNMNAHDIINERNVELRRRMLDLFGVEAFMLASRAQKIQEDECGELYRQELRDDEPIVTVCVTNSTAEPDGHFKKYFLRVPPTVRTAREAVAWTFGLSLAQYRPTRQS